MRIFLLGDPAAGKTTFLSSLKKNLYTINNERLTNQLHKEMYGNLVLKNTAHALYLLERDINVWNTKKITFFEYCYQATYCFIKAHYRLGNMTKKDVAAVAGVLDHVSNLLPINKKDIAIHFTCNLDVINKRLDKRAKHIPPKTAKYLLCLREEIKKRFSRLCQYHHIDTTSLSKQDIKQSVKKDILPWIKYAKD